MRFVVPRSRPSLGKTFVFGLAVLVMPPVCHAFHGDTMQAWHRTWHGPNALYTPLRPYFIPRYPGRCDREPYYSGYGGSMTPSAPEWMPLQSERLGQIPNDMGVGGAAPVAAPGR